jgi:16S rRNA (cytosine1402-N4)-methyltransferase
MHIPFLTKEVIEYLDVRSNRNYIDCTFGLSGHSRVILEKSAPNGKVLGIETDSTLVELFNSQFSSPDFKNRLILVNDSYRNLEKIVEQNNFRPVWGILFDLGMSTWHLRESGRGFSFLKDEPLDMRYSAPPAQNSKFQIPNSKEGLTAEIIVNQWPQEDIEEILKEYGEERFAQNIAQGIVNHRNTGPFSRTKEFVEIITHSVPAWYCQKRIHCATKTFQALRIAVNHELEAVGDGLAQAIEVIEKEGKVAVISFHSLEDRIVKTMFRRWEEEGRGHIVTKKPVQASLREKETNPASRSAKLRVFQKE